MDLVRNLIFLLAVFWVLFSFIIGAANVPNDDMMPRLGAGDLVIYYRIDKIPGIRDMVVLKKNGTEYIGRVVAAGGDKVEIEDSVLMVNGNIVSEDYVFSGTPVYEGYMDYPVLLEEDECFVLCDSREGSEDSRYYGPVGYEEICGTVIGQYRKGSA